MNEKYGQYLGMLFSNFDGENAIERQENFNLGYRACVDTQSLTRREIFTISFIVERMQFAKFGDANQLEAIRIHIIENL